jgi:hypothetical protein
MYIVYYVYSVGIGNGGNDDGMIQLESIGLKK